MSRKNSCPWAKYSSGEDDTIVVENSEILARNGKRNTMTGSAVVNPSLNGTIDVGFSPFSRPSKDGSNYIILHTDNVNFSYVWSCTDYCFDSKKKWCIGHRPLLWILDRQYNNDVSMVNDNIDRAISLLETAGYESNKLRANMLLSNHSECDYDE